MPNTLTFGELTQKNFNFAQVTSLDKTFGNFSFSGYHYEQASILASASVVISPNFIKNIFLYETINIIDGNFEKISNYEIGYLFGDTPINIYPQLSLSTDLKAKLILVESFNAEVIKQIGYIGKVNQKLSISPILKTTIETSNKIISNKNNTV